MRRFDMFHSFNAKLRQQIKKISMGGYLDSLRNTNLLDQNLNTFKDHLAFINCSIFDGINPMLRKKMTLLVKQGKILDVGHENQVSVPESFKVLDVQGEIIMPGLIDGHAHQCSPFSYEANRSTRRQMVQQIYLNCVQNIYSGVTTVCDMGGPQALIKAFTGLSEKNQIPAPRFINCYTMISPKKGNKLGYPSQVKILNPLVAWLLEGQVASRPESISALKKLCYEVKENGGHHLKTTYQAQPFSRKKYLNSYDFPIFGDEWVRTIFEVGKETDLVVDIHAPYREGVEKCVDLAIEVGAKIRIQHMTFDQELSSETIKKMSDYGFYMIPTIKIYGDAFHLSDCISWLDKNPTKILMPEAIRQTKMNIQQGIDMEPYSGKRVMEHDYCYFRDQFGTVKLNTLMANDAGIIGIGTDSGGTYSGFFGRISTEVKHYLDFGISLTDSMIYLTSGNAKIYGLNDIGAIQPGKLADLIIINGDPLNDASALSKISLVMKGGVVLRNDGAEKKFL